MSYCRNPLYIWGSMDDTLDCGCGKFGLSKQDMIKHIYEDHKIESMHPEIRHAVRRMKKEIRNDV